MMDLGKSSRPMIERKIKSLSKYELNDGKAKSLPKYEANVGAKSLTKYEVTKEGERKAMRLSTIDSSTRMKVKLCDIDLETVMNGDSTLHELFVRALHLHLEGDCALLLFQEIYSQVGDLSTKTVLMLGLCYYSQNILKECIRHLERALTKCSDNLFELSLEEFEGWQKVIYAAYMALAEAYRRTNNFLCAVSALNKLEKYYPKTNINKHCRLKLKPNFEGKNRNERTERDLFQLYLLRARLSVELKEYELAILDYVKCIELQGERHKELLASKKIVEEMSCPLRINEVTEHRIENRSPSAIKTINNKNARSSNAVNAENRINNEVNNASIEPTLELCAVYHAMGRSGAALELLGSVEETGPQETGYVWYQKALILLSENKLLLSAEALQQVHTPQLQSEVAYHRALLHLHSSDGMEDALMELQSCINYRTSLCYVLKAHHLRVCLFLFKSRDYYAAQYEVDCVNKIMKKEKNEHLRPKPIKIINRFEWDGSEVELYKLLCAILNILKNKLKKGLELLNELSPRHFNNYMKEVTETIEQFKFYSYYKRREYEHSLGYAHRLEQFNDKEEVNKVNRIMLEALVLHSEGKQSHALSKITEIENLSNTYAHTNSVRSLKALSYMLLYSQSLVPSPPSKRKNALRLSLGNQSIRQKNDIYISPNYKHIIDKSPFAKPKRSSQEKEETKIVAKFSIREEYGKETKNNCRIKASSSEKKNQCMDQESLIEKEESNKEILLSAEDLLHQCVLSEKESCVYYYLIGVIHLELDQYESSLKYIREAIEQSDEHMLKHYFAKGNAKLLLGKYEEAIKDYSDAQLVHREQTAPDEYYTESQKWIPEILLNRAIAYLKLAYALLAHGDKDAMALVAKDRAIEDLNAYFKEENSHLSYLPLYFHTDEPSQLLKVTKGITQEQRIHSYYLSKELNNCIESMTDDKYSFDIRCLRALRRSSDKTEKSIEHSLTKLLELAEEIYQRLNKSKEIEEFEKQCNISQLVNPYCGQIFRWSDLLFYIGVMHFQLAEYETALKYFEESYLEKKNNRELHSIMGLDVNSEGIFDNRIYSKEEIHYNLGVCSFLCGNVKDAIFYLAEFPSFSEFLSSDSKIKIDEELDLESKSNENMEINEKNERNGKTERNECIDITPFPVHNRLCSIYDATEIDGRMFYLSFCLPKLKLPLMGIFYEEEIEQGRIYTDETICAERAMGNVFGIERKSIVSSLSTISLLDIEMKPIAPWLRQTRQGVNFTGSIANESVDLTSERSSLKKKEKQKKHRYS